MDEDKQHPQFAVLSGFDDVAMQWEKWDTAQKNWWIAALEGRAVRSQIPPGDFVHYWCGSGRMGNRGVRTNHDYYKFESYLKGG